MGKALDLTGQKFNRLTAIQATNERKNGLIVWEFLCDCGNRTFVPASFVKNGNTKSCGCLNIDKIVERNKTYDYSKFNRRKTNYNPKTSIVSNVDADSLIGKKFGLLTIKENLGLRVVSSGKRRTFFLCECECGNIIESPRNLLTTGQKKSCGCLSSWGEAQIAKILCQNGIKFSTQKTFPDLRNIKTNRPLKFDFCIYNKDDEIQYIIEFDGRQHRTGPEASWTNSYSFEELQILDQVKNNYCLEKNIPLYRIPSNQIKVFCLDTILDEKFLVR